MRRAGDAPGKPSRKRDAQEPAVVDLFVIIRKCFSTGDKTRAIREHLEKEHPIPPFAVYQTQELEGALTLGGESLALEKLEKLEKLESGRQEFAAAV